MYTARMETLSYWMGLFECVDLCREPCKHEWKQVTGGVTVRHLWRSRSSGRTGRRTGVNRFQDPPPVLLMPGPG